MTENLMEKVVSLSKRRGFIYPGSELYGGLANTYDYGPVGTELLRNIKNLWWSYFVQQRNDVVGLDASLISHHRIWEASGHVAGFADAMIDCKNCKSRFRADHLIEGFLENLDYKTRETLIATHTTNAEENLADFIKALKTNKVEGFSLDSLDGIIKQLNIHCPKCSEYAWTPVRKFNQLFPVELGLIQGDNNIAYLRGETAQGMFVNFKNVVDSNRVKLPFGIAQLGKSFRNEITPGNSVFRTLEFELAEVEYFFDPEVSSWEELYAEWKIAVWGFVKDRLSIEIENLRWRAHTDEERSFYSTRTEDLEYKFPFGFKELWGLAYRTDYDLAQHEKGSGKELKVTDPNTGKKILPHVIEPAVGINRLFLMVLCDAYREEEKRIVLRLHPRLAPYKAAVFPLLANKENLVIKAKEVYEMLRVNFMTAFDDRGNIGKRYLAQDEIGTPWCITIDFQTMEDDTVTIRDRDTGEQIRQSLATLQQYIQEKIV